jgi:hypothetical protein
MDHILTCMSSTATLVRVKFCSCLLFCLLLLQYLFSGSFFWNLRFISFQHPPIIVSPLAPHTIPSDPKYSLPSTKKCAGLCPESSHTSSQLKLLHRDNVFLDAEIQRRMTRVDYTNAPPTRLYTKPCLLAKVPQEPVGSYSNRFIWPILWVPTTSQGWKSGVKLLVRLLALSSGSLAVLLSCLLCYCCFLEALN